MKKLNIAIIGQGRSGRDIHGAYFRSEANKLFEVKAVVELLEDRRRRALTEYGCDVYTDYRELFERKDIDIVVNSTYSYLHYPVTLDLLNHGFNVIVEKPFSAHATDCDDMMLAAKRNVVMLTVFQQSHFAPYFKRIREILASGVLGRIIQVNVAFSGYSRRWDWQCSQRYYGGSMLNTGPHPFEQILTLLDYDGMPQIMSKLDRVNTYGDAEDYVKVIMTAPDRPLFDIEISPADAFSDYTYKIQGDRGTLKSTAKTIKYKYFDAAAETDHKLQFEPITKPDGTPAYCSEKLTWHEEEENVAGTVFTSAVDEFYTMVYDHLENGGELIIKPEKIRQLIAIMEKIHADNPMPMLY